MIAGPTRVGGDLAGGRIDGLTTATDLVRKVYAAFNSGDSTVISEMAKACFADDVVVREAESLPWGGVYQRLETVTPLTAGIASPQSPIDASRLVVEKLIATEHDGSGTAQVVAVVSFPWRGSRRTIPMRALEWFTVRGGKVVEIQVFLWDTAAAMAVLADSEDDAKRVDRGGPS
jgi:ketosteroid isomerase-like protein